MRAEKGQEEDPDFTRAALAMCENIDWNVGRIMQKLKDLDLEDDTIVLYFSDNGPNAYRWNGGMRGKKGSTDEGGVRSPLLMQYPRVIKPGTKIPEIAAAIDLLPTLVAMAGVDFQPVKPLDGLSLMPLLPGRGNLTKSAFCSITGTILPASVAKSTVSIARGNYMIWSSIPARRWMYRTKSPVWRHGFDPHEPAGRPMRFAG